MKKLILACFSLATVVLMGVLFWLQTPRAKNHQIVSNAIADFEERYQKAQENAEETSQNGYLSKTFLPYWGRKGSESEPNTKVAGVVTEWASNYTLAGSGSWVDHNDLFESGDHDYLDRREALEKLLPDLTAALEKPRFVAPTQGLPTSSTAVPNYLALRACAQALAGYGDAKVAEGEVDRALAMYKAGMSLGRKLQDHGILIQEMIGLACQMAVHESLVSSLTPERALTAKQNREIATFLFEYVPPADLVQLSLGAEAQLVRSIFEDIEKGDLSDEPVGTDPSLDLLRLPGIVRREKRIYFNEMAELIEAYQNGSPAKLLQDVSWSLGAYLSGDTGVITAIVFPQPLRASQQLRTSRKQILGAGTSYLIRAYKSENSKYPENLEQLQGGEIPSEYLAPLKAWKATLTEDGERVVLSIPLSEDEAVAFELSHTCQWIEKTPTAINFRI